MILHLNSLYDGIISHCVKPYFYVFCSCLFCRYSLGYSFFRWRLHYFYAGDLLYVQQQYQGFFPYLFLRYMYIKKLNLSYCNIHEICCIFVTRPLAMFEPPHIETWPHTLATAGTWVVSPFSLLVSSSPSDKLQTFWKALGRVIPPLIFSHTTDCDYFNRSFGTGLCSIWKLSQLQNAMDFERLLGPCLINFSRGGMDLCTWTFWNKDAWNLKTNIIINWNMAPVGQKKAKKPATVTIFEGNDYVTLIVNTFSLIF